MPRQFFDNHAKPNYEDWLANLTDERLAKNAVADANNMAERMFRYWQSRDPSQIYGAKTAGKYREALVNQECRDFGLVWDVADAHKHFELDRPSRRITHSDQTKKAPHVYGGPTYYGAKDAHYGGSHLVVTLDDGTKQPLSIVLENVMDMWERLLAQMGL